MAAPASLKALLVALVRPLDAAVNVKLPWVPRVILHPAKVAAPATAVTGLVVQLKVPVPVAIDNVTNAVLVVTTSPDESSILATG